MILHGKFLVCGMKSGLIKLWKPQDPDAHVSLKSLTTLWDNVSVLVQAKTKRLQKSSPC
jgi:hypothetical protein